MVIVLKKLAFMLIIVTLTFCLCSPGVMAAPYYVTGNEIGNTLDILKITNPESVSITVFDNVYVFSGYADPGALINFYTINGYGSYELMPYSLYVGSSGWFYQQIVLSTGKNFFAVRAELIDGRYQQLRRDITLLGNDFVDSIKGIG